MRIKQITLFKLSCVIALFILGMSYHGGWLYLVGVNTTGFYIDKDFEVPVEKRKAAFTGIPVANLDADPEHAGHIILETTSSHGHHITFASRDHGDNWIGIQIKESNYPFIWLAGQLVGIHNERLFHSIDMGKTWVPFKNETTERFLSFWRDTKGQAWVRTGDENYEYHHDYKLSFTKQGLVLSKHVNAQPDTSWYLSGTVTTPKEKLAAHLGVKVADGIWAATDYGTYFRPNNSSTWQKRSASFKLATIDTIVPSPTDTNTIITWTAGRLWKSINRGIDWQPIETPHRVIKANYLSDGNIALAYTNYSIGILHKDNHEIITPENNYFSRSLQARIKQNREPRTNYNNFLQGDIREDAFEIVALGGSSESIWVAAGDAMLYFSNTGLNDHTRDGYSSVINQAIELDGYESRVHRLGLFTYSPQQGWQLETIDKLNAYEAMEKMPCDMSVKDFELYINNNKTPDDLLGVVTRAGWLKGGAMYYAMSDSRVQIGRVKDCQPTGPVHLWQLDGLVVYKTSEVFETEDGIEVVTPDYDGVKVFNIKYVTIPPIWRWLIYHLSFGSGVVITWSLLLLWGLRIYTVRAQEQKADPLY